MTKPSPPTTSQQDARMPGERAPTQRIDKWLWYARFFKTRTMASDFVSKGTIRLTRAEQPVRVEKPSTQVQGGDTLSFMKGERIWVINIIACGNRRGPASEAQTLYDDQSPPPPEKPIDHRMASNRDIGSGRPTKKDRRAIDAFRSKG